MLTELTIFQLRDPVCVRTPSFSLTLTQVERDKQRAGFSVGCSATGKELQKYCQILYSETFPSNIGVPKSPGEAPNHLSDAFVVGPMSVLLGYWPLMLELRYLSG